MSDENTGNQLSVNRSHDRSISIPFRSSKIRSVAVVIAN
jgi:hypothetical protein